MMMLTAYLDGFLDLACILYLVLWLARYVIWVKNGRPGPVQWRFLDADGKVREQTSGTAKEFNDFLNRRFQELEAQLAKCRQVIDRDRERIAELNRMYVSRDNAAIDAGANLVRRDRRIKELETEVAKLGQMNASIEDRLTSEIQQFKDRLAREIQASAYFEGRATYLNRMIVQVRQALIETNRA